MRVSCRQHMDGSCFLIHTATLCLLTEKFSSFTFKVIIDKYVLIDILLLIFCFPFVAPFSFSFALFFCGLVTFFSVMFRHFSHYILCIYSKFLLCDCSEIYISVQFSSVAQSCPTLCHPVNCSTPGLPVHHQLLEFTQTHVHWVGNAIQPSHPLSSLSPPAPIPPSIRVFSNESTLCMRWPKCWSFNFSSIPSKEHPGLISFRMDWLDLLAVQRTLKSLLQHYSSKASSLRCSAFFTVQLSHPYMTTGKNHSLD